MQIIFGGCILDRMFYLSLISWSCQGYGHQTSGYYYIANSPFKGFKTYTMLQNQTPNYIFKSFFIFIYLRVYILYSYLIIKNFEDEYTFFQIKDIYKLNQIRSSTHDFFIIFRKSSSTRVVIFKSARYTCINMIVNIVSRA